MDELVIQSSKLKESKLLTTKKKNKKKVFFLFIKEMIYTLL